MAVVDDLKLRYPELVTQYGDDAVDDRVAILLNDVPAYFGGSYDTPKNRPIILALLAHLLVVDQGGVSGAGGVITAQSAGSVSVSLAAKNSKSALWDFFGGTKYGQTFIQLTARIAGARFV